MEYKEFSSKTLSDAITEACQAFGVTSDKLTYEVVEETLDTSVIEEYAFSECVALEKLSFIRLKKIEQAAFRNCLSLKNIEIRDVDILPEYENNAFQGCIGFTAKDFRAMLLKKKDSLLG